MKVFLKDGTETTLKVNEGDMAQLVLMEYAKTHRIDYKKTVDHYKKHVNKYAKLILAVDDDEITLNALEAYCAMTDCFCIKALSPEEGYALWKDDPAFDIVFTDLNMPGMNGNEFASIIKSVDPDVKVVLLTGDMNRIELLDTVDTQIKKPMPYETFKSTILGL